MPFDKYQQAGLDHKSSKYLLVLHISVLGLD